MKLDFDGNWKAARTSNQEENNAKKEAVFIDRKVTSSGVGSGTSSSPNNPASHVIHLGGTGQKPAASDNSNSLWILEGENTMRGGTCFYSKLYRIKHGV